MWDFTIIGAGVVGTMIARELSRYELKILLLDKEDDVSCGASKANSGIVHGGFDDKQGSLKSKLVRAGNRAFPKLDLELNFGYLECGSLVLAFSQEELCVLEDLKANGIKNGVLDLEILRREAVLVMEPHVNADIVGALYCPTSGITSPYEMTLALAENAVANGVELRLKSKVTEIKETTLVETIYQVSTQDEIFETKVVINCAGVYSDQIAEMIGDTYFQITPRRGEYILLNKLQGKLVNHVLFQTPTALGKGILVTRTYHGNLMLGPNAQETPDREDVSTDQASLLRIIHTARKSVPDFDLKYQLTTFSGLRATSNRRDFIIEESTHKGFFHVAGIESPGLTSSPAIAEYLIQLIKTSGITLKEKSDFNPNRPAIIVPKGHSFEGTLEHQAPEKHIICRCENVTESEIVDALHRGISITCVDGVKRRTRAGMGPCQGNYCGPRVMEIIARECNLPLESVTPGSKRGKVTIA